MYDYYSTVFQPFIIGVIIAIGLNFFAAKKMCEVVELKGHNAKNLHIFAWCFWFPIFGYLYVIALPDLKIRELLQDRENYLQSPQQNNSHDLSNISEISKSGSENAEYLICKKCGEKNPKTRMTCQKCDTYKNAHL